MSIPNQVWSPHNRALRKLIFPTSDLDLNKQRKLTMRVIAVLAGFSICLTSGCADRTTNLPVSDFTPPAHLEVEALCSDSVRITWDRSPIRLDRVKVERSDSSSNSWKLCAELTWEETSLIDDSLFEGTFVNYRISSILNDLTSDPSKPVGVRTPPATPACLSIRQTRDNPFEISLRWLDNSKIETAYEISRRLLPDDSFQLVDTTNANDTFWTDNRVFAGRTYAYRACAKLGSVTSPWSEEALITVSWFPPGVPSHPSAQFNYPKAVKFSWELDSADLGTKVVVERCVLSAAEWLEIARLPGISRSYLDTNIAFNTTYKYRCYALEDTCRSEFSEVVTFTTPTAAVIPPSNLTASDVRYNSITLRWSDNTDDERGFRIQRRFEDSFRWDYLGETARDSVSFTDSSVSLLTTYLYRVCSVSHDGMAESAWTPELKVRALDGPPAIPILFRSVCFDMAHVVLSWEMGSINDQIFLIERRLAGQSNADFIPWAGTDSNETSYMDRDVEQNIHYVYRIRAENRYGISAYTPPDSAMVTEREFFNDDFETSSIGAPPDTRFWAVQTDSSASIKVADARSLGGSQSVEFRRPVGDDTSRLRLGLNYPDTLLAERVRCRLFFPAAGSVDVSGLYSTWGSAFAIQFQPDSTITIRQNREMVVVGRYQVGEWLTLEIVANSDIATYSLSINGAPVLTNQRAVSSQPHRGFEFEVYHDAEFHGLFIDDMEVRR